MYVPACNMMVSVPAIALALMIASRSVQSPLPSTPLVFRQVTAVPRGVMSSKRFGKNVGSGSGIMICGADWPCLRTTTPGRPSMFTRIGIAAAVPMDEPIGKVEWNDGGKPAVAFSEVGVSWPMTCICARFESRIITSSDPRLEIRVRNRMGG